MVPNSLHNKARVPLCLRLVILSSIINITLNLSCKEHVNVIMISAFQVYQINIDKKYWNSAWFCFLKSGLKHRVHYKCINRRKFLQNYNLNSIYLFCIWMIKKVCNIKPMMLNQTKSSPSFRYWVTKRNYCYWNASEPAGSHFHFTKLSERETAWGLVLNNLQQHSK